MVALSSSASAVQNICNRPVFLVRWQPSRSLRECGLCDRLQTAGFVDRVVSPSDRRKVRLYLSNRGRAFLDDLRARRERELREVLALMPADSSGSRTA